MMGRIHNPAPVKLLVGMLAQQTDLFEIAQKEMTAVFGMIDAVSEVTPFDFTDYYAKEMGSNLLRKFTAFAKLINPKELVSAKLFTDELEKKISEEHGCERRLINLDPGYIAPSKLVLATTKDYSHRIYLRDGIFGEVTLYYSNKRFTSWPWTYPDYKTEVYLRFFEEVRARYLETLKRDNPE